jgi:hypothetical protein
MRHGLAPIYLREAMPLRMSAKGFRQLVRDEELAGASSYEIYRRHPATLPHLGLGSFREAKSRAAGAPPAVPRPRVPMGCWRNRRRTERVFDPGDGPLRQGYAFWRGVRRAVSDRDLWRRFTAVSPSSVITPSPHPASGPLGTSLPPVGSPANVVAQARSPQRNLGSTSTSLPPRASPAPGRRRSSHVSTTATPTTARSRNRFWHDSVPGNGFLGHRFHRSEKPVGWQGAALRPTPARLGYHSGAGARRASVRGAHEAASGPESLSPAAAEAEDRRIESSARLTCPGAVPAFAYP